MGRTSAAVRKCGPCGAANGCCPLIGPRSLTGNIRQASGSARSSHAMRFYHLPLATCHLPLATCHLPLGSWLMAHGSWLMAHGSWLMPSLHLAGAKGRDRMRGGRCAHGTHPLQCAVQQARQPAHGREQVCRCVRLVAGATRLHMGVQPAQAASAVAMVGR